MSKDKKEVKEYASFAEEVWDKLTRIDVSDHVDMLPATKKRPEISYLAWHQAWMLLKRKFPKSTYCHDNDIHHEDGTVEVEVTVWIYGKTEDEMQMTNARLSVMDSWMNPIAKPNAREINDSRQRCLVKALAFAGLGLTLWTGDAMPIGVMEDSIDDDQLKIITNLVEQSETNEESFKKWAGVDDLSEITQERYPSAVALLKQKLTRKQQEKK